MSAVQAVPRRTRRTLRRRSRTPCGAESNESEGVQLEDLRARCRVGFITGSAAYLAVLTITVVRPNLLTLKQIVALEFGLGIGTTGCAVVAIFAWMLMHNTEQALRIWTAASRSRSLEAQPATADPTIPDRRGGEAIPISYAREVRAQRHRQAI